MRQFFYFCSSSFDNFNHAALTLDFNWKKKSLEGSLVSRSNFIALTLYWCYRGITGSKCHVVRTMEGQDTHWWSCRTHSSFKLRYKVSCMNFSNRWEFNIYYRKRSLELRGWRLVIIDCPDSLENSLIHASTIP